MFPGVPKELKNEMVELLKTLKFRLIKINYCAWSPVTSFNKRATDDPGNWTPISFLNTKGIVKQK